MRRRTDTTTYLKECMGDALLELMHEKTINKISIEELTAKADVGRSTYFRYFKCKDDVLSFKISLMWERYINELPAVSGENEASRHENIRRFFTFCLSIRQIIDMIYKEDHQKILLDMYLNTLDTFITENDAYGYYLKNYFGYGFFGIVNAWIVKGYEESPEEMAAFLMNKLLS